MAAAVLQYVVAPAWSISQTDTSLIVHGGADARYEIALDDSSPSFFATADAPPSFGRSELSVADQRVLEQLVTARIVRPKVAKASTLRVAVVGNAPCITLAPSEDFTVVPSPEPHIAHVDAMLHNRYPWAPSDLPFPQPMPHPLG